MSLMWLPNSSGRSEMIEAIVMFSNTLFHILGSQILILGGVTTTRMCALSNVESWCPQGSVWIGGFANLPGALSGHGSVTLPPASFV